MRSRSDTTFEDCSSDPSQTTCQGYKYPTANATANLDGLCQSMSWMPGCTIYNLCKTKIQAKEDVADGEWCNPISLLANICEADTMSSMMGCTVAFNKLCGNDTTVINQCKDNPPIRHFPTTGEIKTLVTDMCTKGDHIMPECSACDLSQQSQCDYFEMYYSMCYQMPGMDGCQLYGKICDQSILKNQEPVCADYGSAELPPSMKMYFHTGYKAYILFKGWLTSNPGSYAGACIAVIIFGVIYELLITIRAVLEYGWAKQASKADDPSCQCDPSKDQSTIADNEAGAASKEISGRLGKWFASIVPENAQGFNLKRDAARGGLQFFETMISYSLMLIAMTFNVGLFLCVCLGIALGNAIFSRYRSYFDGPQKRDEAEFKSAGVSKICPNPLSIEGVEEEEDDEEDEDDEDDEDDDDDQETAQLESCP